jgi:hypothetical protein
MNRNILFGIVFCGLMASCASTKNDPSPVISPYSGARTPVGQSVMVYGLPQTRLFFDVELIKTLIKKGPYAEYANRMLGLQNVPVRDMESWQIKTIRISSKMEIDSKRLYALMFTDYPQNLDKLLRFTNAGLLLDASMSNVLITAHQQGKNSDDFQFLNTAVSSTVNEKVDTVYRLILTDTAFVKIPVIQKTVMARTTEEQAREAAQQIFDIRKNRFEILTSKADYPPDGASLKLVLQALDMQEEQLLSLFNGAKIENRQVVTYSALPEKPETNIELFYFSERAGIVSRNTVGAKSVVCQIGKTIVPASITTDLQARNIIYYRIPQVVEVSAGFDNQAIVREQITICQLGNIVSFPLLTPKTK